MLESAAESIAQGWGVPRVAIRFEILDLNDVRGLCEADELAGLGARLVELTRAFVRDVDSVWWEGGVLTILLHDAGQETAELVGRRIRERLPGAVEVSGYLVPIDVSVRVRAL